MDKGSPAWPIFDSPLLREMASAFQRRGKAIRYHRTLSCEREAREDSPERMNIDIRQGDSQLRFSLWEDGMAWVRLCVGRPGAGWTFLDSFHGDARNLPVAAMVELAEATLADSFRLGHSEPGEYRERLRARWADLGPLEERDR